MTNTGKSESMVERVAKAIYDRPTTFDGDTIATHLSLSQIIDASTTGVNDTRQVVMGVCRDAASAAIEATGVDDLIRTATAFVEELRSMGYGETSERALPGSFDNFAEALRKVK